MDVERSPRARFEALMGHMAAVNVMLGGLEEELTEEERTWLHTTIMVQIRHAVAHCEALDASGVLDEITGYLEVAYGRAG